MLQNNELILSTIIEDVISKKKSHDPYHIIGLGLGVENLGLAVALKESGIGALYQFIEEKFSFDWTDELSTYHANMQNPFFEDLITPRNPCSDFSFLNFLRQHNRLSNFLALKSYFPSQFEFQQYLTWVSNRFYNNTVYHDKVVSLHPFSSKQNDQIDLIEIRTQNRVNKNTSIYLANSVILDLARHPYIPEDFLTNKTTIFHTKHFTSTIKNKFSDYLKEYHFAIAGSGQSSIKTLLYLLKNYPNSKVTVFSKGPILYTLDNDNEVNQLLTSKWYSTHTVNKVESDLIKELRTVLYQQRLQGNDVVRFFPFCTVNSIREVNHMVSISYSSCVDNCLNTDIFDAAILATGYQKNSTLPLLKNFESELQFDRNTKQYELDYDYRIKSLPTLEAHIYLQGYSTSYDFNENQFTHLTNRSHRIMTSIATHMEKYYAAP